MAVSQETAIVNRLIRGKGERDMRVMNEMMETQEMKGEVKKNNKGFSLVELIIVIAIMAILVGVVGTQVVPYIEKSRQAKDLQVVSSVCTASVSSFAAKADKTSPATLYTLISTAGDNTKDVMTTDGTGGADVVKEIRTLLGVSSTMSIFSEVFADINSKDGKTAKAIKVIYATDGKVTVQLYADTAASATSVLDPVTSK